MYDNNYYTNTDPNVVYAMDAAAAGMVMIFALIAVLIGYILQAIFLSMIFKKAGIPGWKAWVPVYNTWRTLELGEQKGWWAIVAIIPVVQIVALIFLILAMYRIALNFGKEGIFVLLAIFFPLIWMAWLGLDSSKWHGPKQREAIETAHK